MHCHCAKLVRLKEVMAHLPKCSRSFAHVREAKVLSGQAGSLFNLLSLVE